MTTRGEPAYPDSRPPELAEPAFEAQAFEAQLRDEITKAIGDAEGMLDNARSADDPVHSIAHSLLALGELALIAAKVAVAELDQ